MAEYKPTIGLEIHAELKTQTKMFCDSLNDPDEHIPNTNICPICLGHPGTLPVINKDAVEKVVRVGLALGGKINSVSKFDRKNYFYPDLPKGYQISQYDQPLVLGGKLLGVRIRRVHLEEDTGTLIHDEKINSSLVDFNRAGVPLMELVTEPDLKSGEEVVAFARELQLILRYLGVSDADMERGQMRIEANVSLNMSTKVELKNINSFKAVGAAVAYELERQKELLQKGEKVKHETRGWNEPKQATVAQRSKEEAHDYRYFPEPDLPPFETGVFDIERLREELPELPAQKRARFIKEYDISPSADVLRIIVGEDVKVSEYFEAAVSEADEWWNTLSNEEKSNKYNVKNAENEKAERYIRMSTIINYLTSDMFGLMRNSGISWDSLKITPENLAHLVALIREGRIGSRQAKDVLKKMFETGLDPEDIVKSEGLETVSDTSELEKIVKEVTEKNPKAVEDYKKGKAASIQFLIGQAMVKLKGRGNPESLRSIFEKVLK